MKILLGRTNLMQSKNKSGKYNLQIYTSYLCIRRPIEAQEIKLISECSLATSFELSLEILYK